MAAGRIPRAALRTPPVGSLRMHAIGRTPRRYLVYFFTEFFYLRNSVGSTVRPSAFAFRSRNGSHWLR